MVTFVTTQKDAQGSLSGCGTSQFRVNQGRTYTSVTENHQLVPCQPTGDLVKFYCFTQCFTSWEILYKTCQFLASYKALGALFGYPEYEGSMSSPDDLRLLISHLPCFYIPPLRCLKVCNPCYWHTSTAPGWRHSLCVIGACIGAFSTALSHLQSSHDWPSPSVPTYLRQQVVPSPVGPCLCLSHTLKAPLSTMHSSLSTKHEPCWISFQFLLPRYMGKSLPIHTVSLVLLLLLLLLPLHISCMQ